MRLENKTALVTGGSSGIGKAISIALAAEGASVAVVASSSIDKAAAVVGEIIKAGGMARAYVCDIRDPAAIDTLVSQIANNLGSIDVLVNCAGVFYPTILGETSEKDFDRMIDVNVKGLFYMTSSVAPQMIDGGGGKIINVSSVAAYVVAKEYALYAATKAGVVALTKGFALQLAPHGINVNAIAPGNTETPINEAIRRDPNFENRRAMIDAQTPSQRNFSLPIDIAAIVVFLASEDSRAMHGSTVLADEGRAAGM